MSYIKLFLLYTCATLALLVGGLASATWIARGGGLIYNDVLRSTWIQDANLAATDTFGVSDIGADGSMNWATAKQWIAAMNAARYKGYSDWRFPIIAPVGADFVYQGSFDGSTDYGYNNTSANSELAYIHYVEFGNKAVFDTTGNAQTGYGLVDDVLNPNDESLFQNLNCTTLAPFCPTYWSGTRYGQNINFPTNNDAVWVFDMSIGAQSGDFESKLYRAWAVRSGDVPEPATLALLALGVVGLALSRRSRAA